MEEFDVIVIGAGSGLTISSWANNKGLKTAVIDKGPFGGTCLNRGCIPSKMLIHHADVVEAIKTSEKFHVKSQVNSIDFKAITESVSKTVDEDAESIEAGNKRSENITVFKETAEFVGEKTLKVGDKTIKGEKVFIFAGTRPSVPPVEGLKDLDYLTSTEALRLKELPETLTIIGGGYIAAELAHFYGTLGSKVTIIQRNKFLVPNEDDDIAERFTKLFSKKHDVLLEYTARKAYKKNNKFIVECEKKEGGGEKVIESDQLLVATGRVPNSDLLKVERAGIKTNKHGFIESNEFLETNVPGVWVGGDIAGKYLFKHSANLEAEYCVENAFGEKKPVDYTAMPHAVFSSPQIAGVGLTERECTEKSLDYHWGHYKYKGTGMGLALKDEDGFVKALVDSKSRKILGCHIIGPEASTLIHEVLIAMKHGLTAEDLASTVHVHPAMSEVVQRAFKQARPFEDD